MKNGSGSVKKKIDEVFGHTLTLADKKSLATLIYYPQEKMDIVKKTERHMRDWYKFVLNRLITLCKTLSSKYTRAKVRAAMPQDYAFVMEELITEKPETVFDTSEIKAGYLVFAKNRSWNEGLAGFVTAVTDKEVLVHYHPGIGNVTNHFFIRANEVVAGDWEIRYSADMSEIHVYPEPASDTDTGNGGINDTGGTTL